VPPGKRKTLAVETEKNAFAYVFQGSGVFADASEPRSVRTDDLSQSPLIDHDAAAEFSRAGNRSLVVFDRGDTVTVRAGEQGIRFPAGLRQAVAGAGRLVRADRHEHRSGAAHRDGAAPGRNLPEAVISREQALRPVPILDVDRRCAGLSHFFL
jgi:hypothetical protein